MGYEGSLAATRTATCGTNRFDTAEIRNSAPDARDPIERARGEMTLGAGVCEQSHCGFVERAIAPQRVSGNLGIARQHRAGKTRPLPLASCDDAFPNLRGMLGAMAYARRNDARQVPPSAYERARQRSGVKVLDCR